MKVIDDPVDDLTPEVVARLDAALDELRKTGPNVIKVAINWEAIWADIEKDKK